MSGTLQATVIKDGASSTNNITLDGSGNVTAGANLTVTGTSTLNGNTSVTGTITGSSTIAAATGTLYPIVSGTAQASTSGTSIDFTGVPSWVKRVTVMFNGVSTSGTSLVQVQLGTGGTPTTTGYTCANGYINNANGTAVITATTGFTTQGVSASDLRYGTMIFQNITGNTWMCGGGTMYSSVVPYFGSTSGVIALGGVLNLVRITTVNGTDTFDAGSVNILYE